MSQITDYRNFGFFLPSFIYAKHWSNPNEPAQMYLFSTLIVSPSQILSQAAINHENGKTSKDSPSPSQILVSDRANQNCFSSVHVFPTGKANSFFHDQAYRSNASTSSPSSPVFCC